VIRKTKHKCRFDEIITTRWSKCQTRNCFVQDMAYCCGCLH